MAETVKLKFVEVLALMHSISSAILVGFFLSLSEKAKIFTTNPIVSLIFGAGLLLFILTFFFLRASFDLKKNTIDETYCNISFYMVIGTIIFLVIGIITLVIL